MSETKPSHISISVTAKFADNSTVHGKFDGAVIHVLVIFFFILAFLLSFFGVLENIDPFYFRLEAIVPSDIKSILVFRILMILIRFLLVLAMLTELLRCMPLICIFLIIPASMGSNCVKLLNILQNQSKKRSKNNFLLISTLYKRQAIICNEFNTFVAPATFALMNLGFFESVLVICGIVKMYTIFPTSIYILLPILQLIIFLIIKFTLPYGINIFEHSRQMLHCWNDEAKDMTLYDRRTRKTIRSLRPSFFTAGINGFNLYILKKSLKHTYFMIILDNAITALVSVSI
jgi:hypothetical protein